MKHTKIILAALLSLTLTACGDTSTAEVTETIAKVTENTSSISETVEEETEADTTTAEETTGNYRSRNYHRIGDNSVRNRGGNLRRYLRA